MGSKKSFTMVSAKYPANEFKKFLVNPSRSFDVEERELARGGIIRSRKDITIDGNPGREVKILDQEKKDSIFRMVLAYNRLYMYGVYEPGISESSETYRVFFDNVKLKPY